jgi:hypothetical protein
MKQDWVDTSTKDNCSASTDPKLKSKNDKAYTYLVLACEGKPFNVMTCLANKRNSFKDWAKPNNKKYNAQDSAAYVDL